MAEETQHVEHIKVDAGEAAPVEATDRGLFDFVGKKTEEEEKISCEFEEKVHVSEAEHKEEEEKKHGGLLEKLHRSHSSSSSSSDEEEVQEGGEKIKKKKKKDKKHEDTYVPVEKYDDQQTHSHAEAEEKKGFLDKIKEKIPGAGHKKTEEVAAPPPPPPPSAETTGNHGQEGKKGFLDKIKEKLPGFHAKTEEDKEKEAPASSH